ncbi:MAG: hypothetical protein AB7J40_02285 [Candidatus Altimarinota bacterium]
MKEYSSFPGGYKPCVLKPHLFNSSEKQAFSLEIARRRGQLIHSAQLAEEEFENRYPTFFQNEDKVKGVAVLLAKQLDTLEPISCVMTYEPWEELGAFMISLVFGENSGERVKRVATQSTSVDEELAELLFTHSGNQWNLGHRIVHEDFRGMGIGDSLLAVAEAFLHKRAMRTSTPQTITASAGQFDVFNWFLKNGFQPSKDEDRRKLEKIFSGSSEFFMGEDLYIYHKDEVKIHRPFIGFKPLRVRIKFHKEILPRQVNRIEMICENTSDSVKKVI